MVEAESFVERRSKGVLQHSPRQPGGNKKLGICFNSVAWSNSEVDKSWNKGMTSGIKLVTSDGSHLFSVFRSSVAPLCWQENLTDLGSTGGSLERWPVPFAAAEGLNLCPHPPPPPLGSTQNYGECYPVMLQTSGALSGQMSTNNILSAF